MIGRKQYIKTLEAQFRLLEQRLELENDDEIIDEIEQEMAEIEEELNELEDNVWGDTKESIRDYMYDVIPHYFL